MTTPIKDIDQILDDLDESIQYGEGVTLDYYHSKADLKADLQTYIDNKILEARIDELRKIRNWKGTIFHDHIMDYCGDRIEELIKSNQSKGNDNE